jgi:hypothetical protein
LLNVKFPPPCDNGAFMFATWALPKAWSPTCFAFHNNSGPLQERETCHVFSCVVKAHEHYWNWRTPLAPFSRGISKYIRKFVLSVVEKVTTSLLLDKPNEN